jgi:PII-like signaling protein
LPIVVEVADTQAKIDAIKPKLDAIVTEGLITEEKVKIILYKGNDKTSS